MTAATWNVSPLYVEHGLCANDGSIAIMDGEGLNAVSIANVLPTVEFKRGQGHKLKDDPKRDAHARLIAAAPDLVEALKRMHAAFNAKAPIPTDEGNALEAMCRAALSKAGV